MPSALVWVLLLSLGASIALVAPTIFKLYRSCKVEDLSSEWLENFSPRSYYPMERLLSEEDFTFLSRQPGFDLTLYRKFRRDRLRIFRMYLNRMICDFNRLHLAGRLLLARAPEDQSAVMTRLIWLKFRFSAAVLRAEYQYMLCCLGVRSLSVRVLILRLEELSSQVALLSSARLA